MNPVTLLTTAVDNLWFWTYGIVAGWGVTFTLLVAAVLLLAVRQLKLSRKVTQLENRLTHAERDYNITINKWQK